MDAIATEWNLFSPEELERLPIYQELMLKNGLAHALTVVLCHDDDDMVTLSFLRTARQGPFSANELKSFATILPALHQFGKFARLLGAARDAGTMDILDQMSHGAILVDGNGCALHVNPAAKHLLNDAIGIDSGHVYALNSGAAAKLREELAKTLRGINSSDINVTESDAIVLYRLSGRPVLGEVVPLQGALGDLFRKASAIITLTDPDKLASLDEGACRQLFGLSPAEARLAQALSVGEGIAGFAERSGLAVDTVRKRAKSLLAKTGTRRQAELAALLGRLRRDAVLHPGTDG